jgi:GT2 family glycosyltransferase
MTPDLSVIIISWNAKDYLLGCLRSLSTELQPLTSEIIVVDNASSDGSVAAVRQRFPSVVVIDSPCNLGFAQANNLGIERSRARYLLLVNSDVIVRPGCIGRLLSFMEEHTDVGLVGPKIFNEDLTIQQSHRPTPSIGNSLCRAVALDRCKSVSALISSGKHHASIGMGHEVDVLTGCFWMVRRSALLKVGLLDPQFFMYGEDKDWCVRFWKSGYRLAYLSVAEAIHFGGRSSSREPARFYVEQHRANWRYWKKHHSVLGQTLILAVMLLHQMSRLAAGGVVYVCRPSRRRVIRDVMQRCVMCTRYLIGLTISSD